MLIGWQSFSSYVKRLLSWSFSFWLMICSIISYICWIYCCFSFLFLSSYSVSREILSSYELITVSPWPWSPFLFSSFGYFYFSTLERECWGVREGFSFYGRTLSVVFSYYNYLLICPDAWISPDPCLLDSFTLLTGVECF